MAGVTSTDICVLLRTTSASGGGGGRRITETSTHNTTIFLQNLKIWFDFLNILIYVKLLLFSSGFVIREVSSPLNRKIWGQGLGLVTRGSITRRLHRLYCPFFSIPPIPPISPLRAEHPLERVTRIHHLEWHLIKSRPDNS